MLSRRELLKLSATGLLGGSTSGWFPLLAKDLEEKGKKTKSCILLWMEGGPSQARTFDLKDGGAYKPVPTSVPGIRISEYLPKLAKQMEHMALLRSMSTGESVHSRARLLMHTGYKQLGSESFPALGSIASAEIGNAESDLPQCICIDGGLDGNNGPGSYRPVPAYLGPSHAPLMITDPARGLPHLKPAIEAAEFDKQAELLNLVEKRFQKKYGSLAAAAHRTSYQQAMRLMRSEKVKALDIGRESTATREAYGENKFGQACLLARRLIEAGIPFVEVTLKGWDDHGGADKHVKRRSEYIDPAIATLIADLKQRGRLDDTLIIWMGEFGRSPGGAGNHFARAWTTFLAGGGLKTGQVIGRSDAKGAAVEERPINAVDFMATVCRALGIDYTKSYRTEEGRPIRIVEKGGKPVEELFG